MSVLTGVERVTRTSIGDEDPAKRRMVLSRRWRLGTCAWIVVALSLIFVRSRSLSLDRNVTDRLKYHAIPVAISVLYHGRVHDYTAYQSIERRFQSPNLTVSEMIARTVDGPAPRDDATYYWAADDRGTADYVIAAFALFGPSTRSLFAFYFLVLASTYALAAVGGRWSPGMAALSIASLAAIYSCLAIFPLANLAVQIERPALFEPRAFDLLALMATLHLAFAEWVAPPSTPASMAAVIGQTAIFAFCYHARSSIGWEAAFIIVMNAAAIVRLRRSSGDGGRRWRTLAVLIGGLAALSAYQHVTYNKRYFEDMGARTVWHNALMGFTSNTALAATYHLAVSDSAVIDAVIADMGRRHDPHLNDRWTNENIRNSLGGWSAFNWFEYESAARTLYFGIWSRATRDVLRCYLIDKPADIVRTLRSASLSDGRPGRQRQQLYFAPFSPVAFLIAAPALIILVRHGGAWRLIPGCLLLFAFSLMPSVFFYSVVLTMMGTFASIAILMYFTTAVVMEAGWVALVRFVAPIGSVGSSTGAQSRG